MRTYFLIFSLLILSLYSCSKKEGEGGRSSISGTIEGTDYNKSRAEVTEIVCFKVNGGINHLDYFLLGNPSGTNHIVWYDKNATNTPPSIGTRSPIEVDVLAGESAVTVAEATKNAINTQAGTYYTATRVDEVLIITCKQSGAAIDADKGTLSEFMVDVLTQGKNQITNQSGAFADEDVYIIYGDEDDIYDDNMKTNYDGTFKFSNLRQGTYKIFAYSKDESNTLQPLTPVITGIEVGKNDQADIGTITIVKIND